MKPAIHTVVSPTIPDSLAETRTKKLCGRIDGAYKEGNIEEALKAVEELAKLRVKNMAWDLSKQDKKDIVQDCVVAAWKSKFKGRNKAGTKSTYSTWVMSVIENQIHSALKAVQLERATHLYLSDPVGRNSDGESFTVQEAIGSESAKFEKYRPVESQPFPSAEAFEVSALLEQGLTLKEIAKMKGTTHAALRQKACRWGLVKARVAPLRANVTLRTNVVSAKSQGRHHGGPFQFQGRGPSINGPHVAPFASDNVVTIHPGRKPSSGRRIPRSM